MVVRWRKLLTFAMPVTDSELDTGETVIVAIGDTVIWLVTVEVIGTWLVESLSVVVGV